MRRAPRVRKSRTGQSASAPGCRRSRRRSQPHAQAESAAGRARTAPGCATKTTRPAYGLLNSPASSAMTSAMNTTARHRGDHRAGDRERMASERRAAWHAIALLQALHVRDERVEIGRRQAWRTSPASAASSWTSPSPSSRRMRDPLLDVVGRQLRADAVERVRLAALAGDGVAHLALLRRVDLLRPS